MSISMYVGVGVELMLSTESQADVPIGVNILEKWIQNRVSGYGITYQSIHWKYWCWSWNSNTLATWWAELTHWKRPWCWERLKTGGEGDDRGWDGWMASLTWWTWVWVSSGSWWWTENPGVLESMGSQRVGHDWVTEMNWTEPKLFYTHTYHSSLEIRILDSIKEKCIGKKTKIVSSIW